MSRQKPKCQGKSNLYAFSCDRNATIFLDGKGYCWQHSPIRAATAAQKREAERLEAERKRQEEWQRRDRLRNVGLRETDITDEVLSRVEALGGLRVMIEALEARNISENSG